MCNNSWVILFSPVFQLTDPCRCFFPKLFLFWIFHISFYVLHIGNALLENIYI
jgi:hypothetical protein